MPRQILLCFFAMSLLAGPACSKKSVQSAPDHIAELRAKADSGNAKAQLNLGNKYSKSDGVPEDSAEAVKWYRRVELGLGFDGYFWINYNKL